MRGVADDDEPVLVVDPDRGGDGAVGERRDDPVAAERRIEQRGRRLRRKRDEGERNGKEQQGEAAHRSPRVPPVDAAQGTIFEIGSSRMSLAPAVLSCGIRRFTPRLSTTVSIANPPSVRGDTVGAFIEGTT